MSLMGENIVVKEFKHLRGDALGSLIHPWSLYLMVLMFIRRMLCMFIGGCIDLVGCPLVCRFLNYAASDEALWRRL